VEFFAIDGYADAEAPENSFRPEKPVAETAMLLYAASVASRFPDVASRISEIARLLIPYARSRRTLLNMALHPSVCLDFAVPHVLLTKLGYPDSSFDAVLSSCLDSLASHGHERPSFAAIEQKWITSLWKRTAPGRDWRPDLRNSVLYRRLDILGGQRQDAYAFTHLVMYCTDFGFRAPYLPRSRSTILTEARSLLAKCLDDEDYDLAAEVLLAWPLTGARWCSSSTFAFRVLARVEDQVGVLPAGTTRADRLNKLDGTDRAHYALGTAYHTALVMGLICAASLRPGAAPPVRVPGPRFPHSCVDRLVEYLDEDQGHWQPQFAELTQAERSAVAPLLLDVALAQKCRKHDYQAVSDLLRLASRQGMAKSSLCAQAAQLLERLTICSHAIASSTNGSAQPSGRAVVA